MKLQLTFFAMALILFSATIVKINANELNWPTGISKFLLENTQIAQNHQTK